VWGTTAVERDSTVVWSANVVWGTACGGNDCVGVVWGANCDPNQESDTASEECDNVVWGTNHGDEADNVVWGTKTPPLDE
jgi:hypothetical protein